MKTMLILCFITIASQARFNYLAHQQVLADRLEIALYQFDVDHKPECGT